MRKRQRVYTSTLLVYRIGHPMQLRTSTWARRSHKILTTSTSKKEFDQNRYAFQNIAGVHHHMYMPVLSANTGINHFSIDACLHPMKLERRPNIFIQEGVWSNSVIHRDSVSTTVHSLTLLCMLTRHIYASLHFMEPRWPTIFIREGV